MQGLVESVRAGWGYWGKMGGEEGGENGLIRRVEKGGVGAKRWM